MAVSVGKRKRGQIEVNSDDSGEDEGTLRARFQRAFESKFKPLEVSKPAKNALIEEEDQDRAYEESDWTGLSDDEGEIEIVAHNMGGREDQIDQRPGWKNFMSSKPPTADETTARPPKQKSSVPEEDSSEAANLKHDLALQRLLKESHLLHPSDSKGTATVPEGKDRLKALELRLKDLGAKKSASQQERMPIAHRKGIVAKAAHRESQRRKDAVENGIILERFKSGPTAEKRRERSVGGPSVGKFKGGTLKLSSKDVKSIEGRKQNGVKSRKGRR